MAQSIQTRKGAQRLLGGLSSPGDAASKVARDASKDGGSMSACSRGVQGSLQNISRLETQIRVSIFAKSKLTDPHQEINPRITENEAKLCKKIF